MEVHTHEESLHTVEIGASGDNTIDDGTVAITKMGMQKRTEGIMWKRKEISII